MPAYRLSQSVRILIFIKKTVREKYMEINDKLAVNAMKIHE